MQLDLVAKSSADCDWFDNTQITNHLQSPGFLLCPECQIHSWVCCKDLSTLSSATSHALPDKQTHTHTVGPELTVGPVAPVRCTQAVLSPASGRGVCLPGSAEGLCYEIQPQTAGLLGDGPALPGNPETKHTDRAHTSSVFFFHLFVCCRQGAAVWIAQLKSLFWLTAN